ncbi:hypothetical protein [Streptomyces sp. KL116D]|uniref:hypothetical protein n=1 Tax=Streptomyces sp. KL116D TaxID=3045152 RepID=UPI003556599B
MPGAVGTAAAAGSADRVANWYLQRAMGATSPILWWDRLSAPVLDLCARVTSLFAPSVARAVLFRPLTPTPTEPPTTPEEPAA